MHFASDNTGPVHPRVMEALVRANEGYAAPYGAEDLTETVRNGIREMFEAPDAAVFLVGTGSSTNSLLLATMVEPFQTVFCGPLAHIHTDECGAPEFFTGGSKLTLTPDSDDKINAPALAAQVAELDIRDEHFVQPGAVSITQLTERGTAYSIDEIGAISEIAKRHRMPLHMDGARFCNAVEALGCSPAEMTWKAGVDAVTFGGTKNGLMGVEAAVLFDPAKSWEFELRRKRAGHLFSKHRYLAAQMAAYLEDDLWRDMARAANTACAELVRGLKQIPEVAFPYEPQGNIVFCTFPRRIHRKLKNAGAEYGMWAPLDGDADEMVTCRLVTDWSADAANTNRFLEIMRGA